VAQVQGRLNKALKSSGKSTIGVVTKMTKKAWALSVIPLVLTIYLLGISVYYNRVFGSDDSSRWIFILPPVIVACLILFALFKVGRTFIGVKITLTPTHLSVQGRGGEKDHLQVPWKALIYTAPKGQGSLLRVLQVAGNERSVSIYSIFTPGFEFLCKEVAKRKTFSISSDSMGNMVIDSGKLGGSGGHSY